MLTVGVASGMAVAMAHTDSARAIGFVPPGRHTQHVQRLSGLLNP